MSVFRIDCANKTGSTQMFDRWDSNGGSSTLVGGDRPLPTNTTEDAIQVTSKEKMLPGPTIAGIATGTLAGVGIFILAAFLLYRYLKNRRLNKKRNPKRTPIDGRAGAGTGTLPRVREPINLTSRGASSHSTSLPSNSANTSDSSSTPPVVPPKCPRRPPPSNNVSIGPTRNEYELDTLPILRQSPLSSMTAPTTSDCTHNNRFSATSSTFHYSTDPLASTGPGVNQNRFSIASSIDHLIAGETSHPDTPENWPLPSTSLSRVNSLFAPEDADETRRRRSSQMLAVAGPYLTPEQALGDGYWEAEREQLEADVALSQVEESELDDEEWGAVREYDQEPGVEINETGTVIRRWSVG
ncbi:hypothetical protein BDV95DRAFT_592948 [Massariosphaeria phaeospora]|uniref:Uncharacterized protein n=1 Tax=Massariosphaeria phaeospora TaxID=100035 RepID=A0A7C8MNK7_9PLEO|nr:hypothetical protein BDV95DRAFT_592948 [Massariosphaeria phaeospora]